MLLFMLGIDALIASCGAGLAWIGFLAKSYFTDLASLKLEEMRQHQENEQRKNEKQEKYYEMLLQNILLVVGEEKDRALALQEQIVSTNQKLIDSNQKVLDKLGELKSSSDLLHQELRNCFLPTIQWSGEERRNRIE